MMDLDAARAELDKIASALEEDILIWNERRMLERREGDHDASWGSMTSGDDHTDSEYLAEVFAWNEATSQRGPLPAPPHRAIKITTAGGKSRRLRR